MAIFLKRGLGGVSPYKQISDGLSGRINCRNGLENILVMDAGRYGFVKLQYYKEPQGFDDVITFTDSQSMFENLWQEWLDTKLYLMAKGTPLMEKGYGGVLKSLPEEKQKELTDRKADFAIKAGITL